MNTGHARATDRTGEHLSEGVIESEMFSEDSCKTISVKLRLRRRQLEVVFKLPGVAQLVRDNEAVGRIPQFVDCIDPLSAAPRHRLLERRQRDHVLVPRCGDDLLLIFAPDHEQVSVRESPCTIRVLNEKEVWLTTQIGRAEDLVEHAAKTEQLRRQGVRFYPRTFPYREV